MYFKLSRKFAAVERNENHAMHPFSFWCNRNGIFIIWTNTTQFTSYRKHTLHMRSWRYPDRSWLLWRMNKHQRKCIWWNEDDGNLMNFVCVCSMNIETVSNVLFPVTLFGPVSFLTLSLFRSPSLSRCFTLAWIPHGFIWDCETISQIRYMLWYISIRVNAINANYRRDIYTHPTFAFSILWEQTLKSLAVFNFAVLWVETNIALERTVFG